MPRRNRLKNAPPPQSTQQKIHYRLSSDLPINAKVIPTEIDCPVKPGDKIIAFRSTRDDPLAAMRAAGQIDECQFLSGRHWQFVHIRSEVGAVKAIDPTKEPVDGGGGIREPINDTMRRALSDLTKAAIALGWSSDALIRDVLGKGYTVREAATLRGIFDERGRLFVGSQFRQGLNTLAVVFGYATGTTTAAKS